jgi:hypothetical protein
MNEENGKSAVTPKVKTTQQKKIAGLMSKPELNNRESVKLNHLIEKEIKRSSPPEPLEIKSSIQVSQKLVNNDSAYWDMHRPIPLSLNEKTSFIKKDSFLRKSVTPRYKDSVRDSRVKFKVKHLIFGKNYNYSIDSIRQYEFFTIPKLVDPTAFSFNSVDGLRMELPFSYYKADSTGHTIRLNSNLAYAFMRNKLDASFSYNQRFRGLQNSWLSASVGTTTDDYNRGTGISTLTNEFYTLFLGENYKKFYRRDFAQLTYSRDIANGLSWNEMVEFSDNSPLSNHSSFTFFDNQNKVFSSNIPENPTLRPEQLESHQTFAFRFQLEYTPHNRYRIQDHKKIYAGSKYPTFNLGYKSAFSSVFGGDSRYSQLRMGIRQKIDYGFDNHFSWQVNAGKFFNTDRLFFEDFQHFNTQYTQFGFSSLENSLRLLPYYQFSTGKQYAEVHANFGTYKLLLKQLPFVRNASFSEKLFVNYLTTPEIINYMEAGYGINNLFLLLDAEIVAGFENGSFRSLGFKVSLKMK